MKRRIRGGLPEWAAEVAAFRQLLKRSQHELGKELGVSAMTISRWESGKAKPPADAYIGLGNLAGDSTCWRFWSRAGLNQADVLRVMPKAAPGPEIGKTRQVLTAHAGIKKGERTSEFVAIPLLPIYAAAPGAN